ncbi:MAG: hypothetical protein II889_02545 [Clostridia bacterium]|nr:hypothetical protein [Clostridia bacterium]
MKLINKPKQPLGSPADVGSYLQTQGMAEDLSDYIGALRSEKRYLFVPRRYFIRTFALYALTFTLIGFFCHGIFVIPMIPAHVLMCFKLRVFCNQCASFNLSGRKLMFLMAVWYLLSLILTRLLWVRLEDALLSATGYHISTYSR